MENLNLDDYKEIPFKELYDVDNVMATNDDCWVELDKKIGRDEKVIIDCLDVTLMKPWNNDLFKKFLNNHVNVYFRIHSDESLCNSINIACNLMGLSRRAIQNKLIANKKVDIKQVKEEEDINNIMNLFVVDGDKVRFVVSSYNDSIGSVITFDLFEKAIKRYIDENEPSEFVIEATNIYISGSLVNRITDMLRELNRGYTVVKFNSDDIDLNSKIDMKNQYKPVNSVSDKERYGFLATLSKNYPCMLIRYKNNRAKDEFGRTGRGEIGYCRAAIIKEVNPGYVIVDTFNGDDFFTYEHLMMERDGVDFILKPATLKIPLHDVGFGELFLGEKFHIIRAIQEDKNDSCMMYEPTEDGFSKSVEMTIPERMMKVFDSWDITYERKELLDCIKKTNEKLGV
jgi:hypothetical protein